MPFTHLVSVEEGAGLELVPDVGEVAEDLPGDLRGAQIDGDGVQHLLPRPDPLQVSDRVTAAHLTPGKMQRSGRSLSQVRMTRKCRDQMGDGY